jgi:hypothetical protein
MIERNRLGFSAGTVGYSVEAMTGAEPEVGEHAANNLQQQLH